MNTAVAADEDGIPLLPLPLATTTTTTTSSQDPNAAATPTSPSNPSSSSSSASLKRNHHLALLLALTHSLTTLTHLHLAALYYLDSAFLSLFLRTLVHHLFLVNPLSPSSTPSSLSSPQWSTSFPSSPTPSSGLVAILASLLLGLLLHLVGAPPAAGEATGFYLHGGVLIDFVGQRGPSSRWRMVGLDLLVAGLQAVVWGVGIEGRRLGDRQGGGEEMRGRERQDLEAEERGEGGAFVGEGRDGSERRENDEEEEDEGGKSRNNVHPLDEFYTGNTVLVELDMVKCMKRGIRREILSSSSPARQGESAGSATDTGGGFYLPGLGLRWRIPT